MQRTKSKLLSILLILVMLLSLLPTTALAADYPGPTYVSVDGGKSFTADKLYFRNGETQCSADSANYNAYYDPTAGTLTLNGYDGGAIVLGGAEQGDLTIKLMGNNTIRSTTSQHGVAGNTASGSITITADSSSDTLTIDVSNSTSYVYGIDGNQRSVTISGSADVTIIAEAKSTDKLCFGINSLDTVSILGNASVDIKSKVPENNTGSNFCRGINGKKVAIETGGTIMIDVTAAGDAGADSYGVDTTSSTILTKVGEMQVKWKKGTFPYVGGAISRGGSFDINTHAVNVDKDNCFASYRFGTPRTVTVENGTFTGPGVPNATKYSGKFLENDMVSITPSEKRSSDGTLIPFKEWTAEGVTFDSPAATANNSFTVPGEDVTVTAKHSPFVGTPTFTPTDSTGTEGTLTFKTEVKPGDGSEYFRLVKDGEQNDEGKYKKLRPDNHPSTSPYEYSYGTTSSSGINQVEEGDYYVAEYLNGAYYWSEKFTVSYTAAPAGNYPDSVRVYNASGAITSLDDGQCLVTNDASATSYTGGAYVARYEKSTGTLYLKDYHGVATDDRILADGDLKIEVEGDSSFSTSVAATNDLYGIQANGKLNISGSGKLTVTANGDGNVYGIYAKEGVTISAPLNVQVGKVDSSNNGPVYGIYTQSGAIFLSDKDKTITATGGAETVYGVYNAADTSTAITENGNITISGKLTVNLSNGSYNRGISSQGGVITLDGAIVRIPGSYYYGIFNKNGNVDIKNNSDVDISSDISSNNGICTDTGGDLTIEDSTVKVSANGLAANLKGNVSIKDSTIELTKTANHHEVIRTGNSSTANTIDLSGSGSVTLTALGNQSGSSMIGGTVSLVGNTKCETGTYYSSYQNYSGAYNATNGKTVLKFMHDATTPTASVGDVTIAGTTGTAITDKDVVITLTNDKFYSIDADTVVSSWFTNLPAGLEAKIKTKVNDNDITATIKISGNPSVASSAALAITIPEAKLVTSTSALDVMSNPNAKFAITAPATPIAVPTANSVTYDGTEKTGVNDGTGYTLSGTYKATDVGATNYTATATLDAGYKWDDGSTGVKTITWNIGKRTPTATDFTFDPPTDLTYDGNNKTASFTLNSPFTNSGAITVKYEKDGASVTETKDVGEYTVKIDVAGGGNFTTVSDLNNPAWKFSITPADQSAPTGLGVAAPTTSSGNGKITGTTDKMEYSTDSSFASPTGTTCTNTATEVAPGTYYVRLKADANHNAGTAATVTVPAYGATSYSITVTNDGNGAANADKISAVAGETVTLTATPNSGYVFDKWDNKTPAGLTIGADGKFTMPSENVRVKATFKPAALTGTASITGTLKYGQDLTATLTGSNNTGNLDYKWYQNGTTLVATNNTGKYTLRADDIGKTITVKITSNVQTGEITSSATGTIDRADGPAAPAAFTLTFTPNADGTTYTATIPTVAGGEYSFDGTNYSATNTKANCAANTSYTGHVRIAATSTHKASTATSSTQTSPKLTVATPTFTPNGASSFTGTQSVTISCTTVGATIHYTTDGTAPTASSPVYSTALSLTSTTTVKAIAVKTDMNDSAIATATFTKYSGGGGGGSYTPSYTVSVDKTENGTITVSPKSASKGDTVTITVKPDKGYELDTLKVLDKNGDKVKLTEKNGKYTFTMPTGKVTVKGSFVEEAPVHIFKDVPVDAYYYEAVKWAAEKGITGGVGNGLFAPNQPCTRAQIVTFLWRAAGSPAPKHMSSFADVPADAFYAKAVAWAVENGITGGTGDGKFSPDATCTRAQSVTFLYRAAGSPKVSSSAEFGDVATNAYYADAVAWAAKNGITGGIGGGQFGSGNDCTRAQIVTFLYRNYQSK